MKTTAPMASRAGARQCKSRTSHTSSLCRAIDALVTHRPPSEQLNETVELRQRSESICPSIVVR
jgi:hypothetical protein